MDVDGIDGLATVLYISYDGLTDSIGQSQVLPYLLGCSEAGHDLTVISFEKADRYELAGPLVRTSLIEHGIDWMPQRFHSSPPYIAKAIDLAVMHRTASAAARRRQFDLVHARSYQAAVTGLKLKNRYGPKLLFDMRGFWPDQRREGGRWGSDSLLGRYLYRRWKSHEAQLIQHADHVVSLTQAGRLELMSWPCYRDAPVSVIPCCADFDLFRLATSRQRTEVRARLRIPEATPVLGYLGSIGTVYRLGPHFALFRKLRDAMGAKALFICREPESSIIAAARKLGFELEPDDMRVVHAERADVPYWLGAVDVATCFITPTFSSLGVSPTKLGEYWACGIPVYVNEGIGDASELLRRVGGGHVLPDFSEASIERAAQDFTKLAQIDATALRERARQRLDLALAIRSYSQIYGDLQRPVSLVG